MHQQRKIQHLYLRAGFGEKMSVIAISKDKPLDLCVDEVFNNSASYTDLQAPFQKDFQKRISEINMLPSKQERIKAKKELSPTMKELNFQWLLKLSSDKAQLREKMTLFWHGHFSCRSDSGLFAQYQNNTLRRNALGKFSDLLIEMTKDTTMLQFLNSQQNRKGAPNENFSRELLEIFTLGRGHYTEEDVREAARAFTGYGFDEEGEFQFRPAQHDKGKKRFLNRTGNFDGEDIINIILEEKRTSEFITEKIYKFFVNSNPHVERLKVLSESFYATGYDIEKLMKNILYADWFYAEENIGARIKSPIELVVGLMRIFDVKFSDEELIRIQRDLGQVLLDPPNVAGWPEGRDWIDSSSLLYRLRMPERIFYTAKGNEYLSQTAEEFSNYKSEDLQRELSLYLLQKDLNKQSINAAYANTPEENKINIMIMNILSTPEYQLC
jgi:uncharacterized protein (DUF1800 family)